MKMNRIAKVALCLALVCAVLSPVFANGDSEKAEAPSVKINKTGLPISNETLTFELAANTRKNKNFEDLEFFKKLEEKTNINIEWNMSSEDGWQEKKSLLFASNMLPDAFYGQDILTDVDIIKYSSQGMIIPLEDYIDEYAPHLAHVLEIRPQYRRAITAPDGHIYTFPSITELNPTTHDHFFMRKGWLEKFGLEVPTTLEEFEHVLQVWKDNDCNGNGDPTDEIPFSFRYSSTDPYNRQQGLQSLFGAFGQLDDIYHFIVDDNGKVIYTPQTEPYKEAISYFHNLYAKGLVDKECFTHNLQVYASKIQDPADIVGCFLGWSRSATAAHNSDEYILCPPFKNPEGKQIWRTVDNKLVTKGAFAITSKCKCPEALVRWIDESYEPETSLELNQGLLGHGLERTENGGYRYKKLPKGVVIGTVIHDFGPGNDGCWAVMPEVIDKLEFNKNLKERRDNDIWYSKYNVPVENMYPNVFFTEDEIENLDILRSDIESYVMQKYASWIVEGGVEQEWNAFQKKLNDMGVEEYKSYYQAALDRYNSI